MNPLLIDIQTIFILLNITSFIMLLMLFLYGISTQLDFSLRVYILAKILQLTGTLILFSGGENFKLFLRVGEFIMCTGFSIETYCIIFIGINPGKKLIRIFFSSILTILLFLIILPLIFSNKTLETIISPVFETILFLITGNILLFFNNKTKLRKLSGLLFLLMTFPHILIFSDIFFQIFSLYFSDTSLIRSVFLLFIFTKIVLTTMVYLLLHWEISYIELKKTADRDFLTGIYNRREFLLLSKMLIHLMNRQQKFISIIMMDLDKFKNINDTYGHLAGDNVLIHFVKTVKKYIRKQDIFARHGGEEFIIFLPGASSIEAHIIAERIRSHLEKDETSDSVIPSCTVSIGITSIIPDNLTRIDALIHVADCALYEAKQTGRNRIVIKS